MDTYVADLDEQTARLILQLLLEDLNDLSSNMKGKDLKNVPTNFACAPAIYENDPEAVTDHDTAKSILPAVRTDSRLIKDVQAEGQQASEHRRMRLDESGTTAPAPSVPKNTETSSVNGGDNDVDDNLLENMSASDIGDSEVKNAHEDDIYSASSAPGNSVTKYNPLAAYRRCCTCGDEVFFFDIFHAPCHHHYCQGCLQELFRLSLTDETLFPPRCCRVPIPAAEICDFLTPQLVRAFQARKVEMETTDRTYCHVPTCSQFIPPDRIEDQIGRCVACTARTCSVCKAATHVGDCPEDLAAKELDNIAAENGWRRCNACRRVVELISGCNHITCPCGAQFCYLCGKTWKKCGCPMLRRQRTIANDQRTIAGLEADYAGEIHFRNIPQEIPEDYEFENHAWMWMGGGNLCQECLRWLPNYVWRCARCPLQVCNRCRYNRL